MNVRIVLLGLALQLAGCGAGVPISIRADSFTFEVELDEVAALLADELSDSGVLPDGLTELPEVWPASLEPVDYRTTLTVPPVPIDLNPEPDDPDFDQYEELNRYADAIRRVEVNELVVRSEENGAPIDFPALTLQLAADPNALEGDRSAWFSIGTTEGGPVGFVGDRPMTFSRGGESFLNTQLGDEERDFALRAVGEIRYNTEENPLRPRGRIALRVIFQVTFFVEPDTLLGTL